jgi:proline iminopeptidase
MTGSAEHDVRVAVAGGELHCAVRGNGPVCLVLCSIGAKAHERTMPRELQSHLKLVYVDLRASCASGGEAAELTFDVLARDLDAVCDCMGAAEVAVFGHSILGALAIEYAKRSPGRVSHVIAVCTPPRGDMQWLGAKAMEFFEAEASADQKKVLKDNLSALGADASPAQMLMAQTPMRFFNPQADAAAFFADAEVSPALLGHLAGEMTRQWDVMQQANLLRAPTFLALGRCDYVSPWVLWNGVAERLPSVARQIFERSGHQPFFEEPEEFADRLLKWMRGSGFLPGTAV